MWRVRAHYSLSASLSRFQHSTHSDKWVIRAGVPAQVRSARTLFVSSACGRLTVKCRPKRYFFFSFLSRGKNILGDPRAVSGGGKKFKSKLAEDFFSPVLDFFPPPLTAPGSPRMNQCLLGFVCRSINLPIFTEISRFFLHQSPDFRCYEAERSASAWLKILAVSLFVFTSVTWNFTELVITKAMIVKVN